uniref:Uncharacterized protein n=1 Tax=Arundo donax TaxID=35708 RepID=A0A0A8YDJ7_ARUDO
MGEDSLGQIWGRD